MGASETRFVCMLSGGVESGAQEVQDCIDTANGESIEQDPVWQVVVIGKPK